jgi:hypothetical protein
MRLATPPDRRFRPLKLAEVGAWGVNLHDNDLVPIDATTADRDCIVRRFKQACDSHGIVVPMATVSLFFHPVFRDGAFTANDPEVRAYALQKTLRAMDLGAELDAKILFCGAAVRALRPMRAAGRMRPSSDCAKRSTIYANTTSSADMV